MSRWFNISEGGKALIVYEEDDMSAPLDTVSISMLVNNKIPYLVPVSFSQVDEMRYVKFNISSRIAFREFLERPTSFNIVSELFINMCNSFIELRKYMIDGSALILNTDSMFIDTSLSMASFIIEPRLDRHIPVKYNDFFKGILFSLQIMDNDKLGNVVNMLNSRNFSLEGFAESLRKLNSEGRSNTPLINDKDDFSDFADRQLSSIDSEQGEKKSKGSDGSIDSGKQKSDVRDAGNIKTVETPTPPADKPAQPKKQGLMDIIKSFGGDKKEKDKKSKGKSTAKNQAPSLGGIAIPGMEPDPVQAMGVQRSQQFEIPVNQPDEPLSLEKPDAVPQKQPEPQPLDEQQVREYKNEPYMTYASLGSSAARVLRTDEADDDTTELMGSESSSECPRLIRLSTSEIIDIDKETFNLGRDPKSLLDYVINDKRVGRRHASIMHKNGNYFIVDLGSKNHTYVNGNMLISNMEQLLNNGDKIRLAVEEFIFQL